MTTKNNATATAKNQFTDLLRKFEIAYATDPTATETATALTDLATACALSVLKKCIDLGYNNTLVSVRNDLNRTRHNLETMTDLNNRTLTETVTTFTKDGDERKTLKILDRTAYDRTFTILHELDGDGYDLVQVASLELLAQAHRMTAKGETVDLERTYTARKLVQRTYVNKGAVVNARYSDVETTPIQEVYKAVRGHINDGRAMATDPKNGYMYIDEIITDETDPTVKTTAYRRLPKHFDLVSTLEIRGGNKGNTTVTMSTDRATVDRFDELMETLTENLTDRQLTVLKYRLQGKSYRDIASKLGVTARAIVKTMNTVQKKCIDLGIKPTATETETE